MGAGCLDESTILAFLDGNLVEPARGPVEAHLASCPACADLTTWAAASLASRTRPGGRQERRFLGQLEPGARVGRYQILEAVGRGGMGEVYAAYHPELDRRIALKVVSEAGVHSAERRSRLLREARAIARLSHPNVVVVHDAGMVGDRVYIAMEYVDGTTLDQWVASAPRTWREVLDVFIAAGRGLAAAHAAELVHRDFKPQNVMIGKDGAVRVMDFGLARLVSDVAAPSAEIEAARAAGATPALATITKTGALLGTPAYMAPEQFRGEPPDARADQFSFCVALYEALYGSRPEIVARTTGEPTKDVSKRPRAGAIPAWLRGAVLKGLAADPAERHTSMDALLGALAAGRASLRRRLSMAGAAAALLLLTLGGWRLARGGRIACEVPEDRLAGGWSGKPADPRREKMRRAFLGSGREQAETSWQRVSATLDEHVRQWRAMYLDTCEATHLRGEQSAEVLDLRMRCLGDNLDQLAALTTTLMTADAAVVGRAVGATKELTPVARCADVPLLKSAVPLPRDEATLRKVQGLRRAIAEAEALRIVGNLPKALSKALALRSECEATGYKPILAGLLELIGLTQAGLALKEAEGILEDAFMTAQEGRDDGIAARAAIDLVWVGSQEARERDSDRWARIANAILDRLGSGHDQIRGWLAQNRCAVLFTRGDFAGALKLCRRAVTLKEEALGPNHPDVAISVSGVANVLVELDQVEEALDACDRALAIYSEHGDPDSLYMATTLSLKGEILLRGGRIREAKRFFERAMDLYQRLPVPLAEVAVPLEGLGEVNLAEGEPSSARTLLERAARIAADHDIHPGLVGSLRFALGRAIWESGGDKRAARQHVEWARTAFANYGRQKKAEAATEWLATHPLRRR